MEPHTPLEDRPSVSVFIAAAGADQTVAATIASVAAQRFDGGRQVTEIVVATADTATRRAAEMCADETGRLLVVDNPSGRTPDGLNAAVAATTGDVLVRVDAHVCLPDGYIDQALVTLRQTGAANVGGTQRAQGEDSGVQAAVAAVMNTASGSGGATYRQGGETGGPADTVYLGVFRRDAFASVGGFHPAMWRNQDAELNVRLRDAGHVVWFDPNLEVAYPPRRTLGGLARQYVGYGRFRRLTVAEHPSSVQARQLAPPLLILALLAGVALLPVMWLPLACLVALYGAFVATATWRAPAGVRRWVPLVLATMHLCWGAGFLLGPPHGARTLAANVTVPTVTEV